MITGSRLKEGGFLTADILLTSPRGTYMPPMQIPSFQTTADSPGLEAHTVVGLCQKIVVVNEHFAVAFAGSVPDIQDAVRLIDKLKAQSPDLTGKRFMEALLADDRLKTADLKAIVLSAENDEIQITNYCAEFGVSNEHFELHVGGSGLQHAVQHYEQFALHAFDVPEEDIVVQGTCMALDQFARHLTNEFEKKFQAETIADLFGGGFEVVAYHSGKFHKVPDVVYGYAEAELDADGILLIDVPKFLLKSTYQGDDLIIRSVEIYYDEDEEGHKTRNDRTFTIAPITRYRETYVQDDCVAVNFLGEFLCYLVKVNVPSGSFTIPFIRKYDGHHGFETKAFYATALKGYVKINFSDTFLKELEASVLDWMRQNHEFIA